jgi:hypothetical protein
MFHSFGLLSDKNGIGKYEIRESFFLIMIPCGTNAIQKLNNTEIVLINQLCQKKV